MKRCRFEPTEVLSDYSILLIVSKIIDRVIQAQITNNMLRAQLFHPNHHAYRSFHSTTTAMLSMHNGWIEVAERGLHAGVVMIDKLATFNVMDIPISLFIFLCEIQNFNPETLKWLQSYLSHTGATKSIYRLPFFINNLS